MRSPTIPSRLARPFVLAAAGLALTLSTPAAEAFSDPVTPPVFSDPLASTNPYAPFVEGAYKVYVGKDEGERIVFIDVHTDITRTFMLGGSPVETHLMLEVEFVDGELEEISANYFAEADDGTVYYFGETVDIYEDGEIVDHDGSWLVGGPTEPGDPVDTATATEPAVFFPGDPDIGDQWKPEDLFPVVDETVTLQAEGLSVSVPAGDYTGVVKVRETSDIDPDYKEKKWYAPGVGVIKVKADSEKLHLYASSLLGEDEDE